MDEKPASIALEDNEDMEDDYEEKVNRHCCCGCLCDKSQWIMRQQQQQGEINEGCWFKKKAKKLRQILECNFIGRFCIHGICNKKKNKRRMQFHYDPQSYALNFDDGYYNNRELDDPPLGDFAARFTAPHQTTDDIA
ncbi:hypothetical protein ACSBR1_040681 [Camellia fascicularis]